MSILGANLKLYSPFQKQSWFYQYALFMQVLPILNLGMFINKLIVKKEAPISILMLSFIFIFIFGQMVSKVQMDVLSKPFSYCLPNNDKMPRCVIFIIGIITAIIYTSLAFLLYQPKELNLLLTIIPIITLTSYILGVCTSCDVSGGNKKQTIINILFIIAMFFLLLSGIFPNKLLIFHNDARFFFVLPLLFACIFLVISAWILLGDPELKRKCFEKPFSIAGKLPDVGSIDQLYLNNMRINHKFSDLPDSDSRIAMLFYKKMNIEHCFTVKHSLLGKMHYLFSRHFALNRKEPIQKLFLVSLIFFISGYLGNDSTQSYFYLTIKPGQLAPIFIMCFMLSSIFAPSSHNLLLPEGRSIKYRISFLIWVLKYFLLTFLFFIVIGASWISKDILPELDFFGYHFTYSNIGVNAILWALVIMPVVDLMFSYVDIPYRLTLMIMLTSGLFILSSIAFFTSNIAVHTVLVLIMVLITNCLFFSLLTRHWFRCDHV